MAGIAVAKFGAQGVVVDADRGGERLKAEFVHLAVHRGEHARGIAALHVSAHDFVQPPADLRDLYAVTRDIGDAQATDQSR